MIRARIEIPDCGCCGAEYKTTGCVRGFLCQCYTRFGNPCSACTKCKEHCECGAEDFPMLDGPPIPVELAKQIYLVYRSIHDSRQTFRSVRECGGYTYGEVKLLMKARRAKLKLEKGRE